MKAANVLRNALSLHMFFKSMRPMARQTRKHFNFSIHLYKLVYPEYINIAHDSSTQFHQLFTRALHHYHLIFFSLKGTSSFETPSGIRCLFPPCPAFPSGNMPLRTQDRKQATRNIPHLYYREEQNTPNAKK